MFAFPRYCTMYTILPSLRHCDCPCWWPSQPCWWGIWVGLSFRDGFSCWRACRSFTKGV
uniref:Uncharacterized protein n=1 Tax=Anguilla anguilla TaxID=7936 RepID=A0A0E9SMB3_ANGAN